jgi:hypothetical protein
VTLAEWPQCYCGEIRQSDYLTWTGTQFIGVVIFVYVITSPRETIWFWRPSSAVLSSRITETIPTGIQTQDTFPSVLTFVRIFSWFKCVPRTGHIGVSLLELYAHISCTHTFRFGCKIMHWATQRCLVTTDVGGGRVASTSVENLPRGS